MITAGGEGLIRTWRLNGVTGTFEHLALLEGHTRGVTTLLLIGTALWSGSMDRSIRCWDVGSGTCRGILTSANGGHKEPVTCMEVITMDDASTYVVSGGADAELIIWDMLGNKSWGGSQGGMVTCLRASQDTVGKSATDSLEPSPAFDSIPLQLRAWYIYRKSDLTRRSVGRKGTRTIAPVHATPDQTTRPQGCGLEHCELRLRLRVLRHRWR